MRRFSRSPPCLLSSFQQSFEERFYFLANEIPPVVLPFDHASCKKSGTDTGRVLEELSDVTFGLDRILMDAQQILTSPSCLHKTDPWLSHRPAGEICRIAGSFGQDADLVECGIRWRWFETSNRFTQFLKVRPAS